MSGVRLFHPSQAPSSSARGTSLNKIKIDTTIFETVEEVCFLFEKILSKQDTVHILSLSNIVGAGESYMLIIFVSSITYIDDNRSCTPKVRLFFLKVIPMHCIQKCLLKQLYRGKCFRENCWTNQFIYVKLEKPNSII